MGFVKTLFMLSIIPLFGFGVSKWVLSDINNAIQELNLGLTLAQICTPEILATVPDLHSMCNEVYPVLLLEDASIVSGLIAILLLLLFLGASLFAGKNRTRIAFVFPPMVFICLFVLAALVLIQGIILTYGAYIAEVTAIGRVHFILIGCIGLAALIACLNLIIASFKLVGKRKVSIIGKVLDRRKHSKIYKFVEEVAQSLKARNPDNIVVGLEPNFYVTSATVVAHGDDATLKGETLYLSLPLARIFTKEELKAVIGHELGHFRGRDTFYSLKFAPVYSGLTHAIYALSNDEEDEGSISDLAKLPAIFVLSYMIESFHKNVSEIDRQRELEADKAATEVAAPQALATSLLKLSLYAGLWSRLEGAIIERLKQNKATQNISRLFSSIVKYDIDQNKLPEVVAKVAEETIEHPTDTHPPTGSRIKNIGINLDRLDKSLLLVPKQNSIDLIDDHKGLEEELTLLQQKIYIALGVEVPEETESTYASSIIAAFGAHMTLADGKIEPQEVEKAEAIGVALHDDFDIIEFREYCHYPETLPKLEDLIDITKELSKEGKEAIYNYLVKIAESDHEVSAEEEGLLQRVKNGLNLK